MQEPKQSASVDLPPPIAGTSVVTSVEDITDASDDDDAASPPPFKTTVGVIYNALPDATNKSPTAPATLSLPPTTPNSDDDNVYT